MKRILLIIPVFLIILAGLACKDAGKKPAGWVNYEDPSGFTLAHPPGWNVSGQEHGLVRINSGDSTILIQPFFSKQESISETWTRRVPGLFSTILPGISLKNTRRINSNPDEMYADFSFSMKGREGAGALICSIYRGSGIFYLISSAKESFPMEKKTMVSILKTFRFVQPSKSKPLKSPGIKYTTWSDPKENAFSVDVPSGWEVSGGLFRFASVDTRPSLLVLSPDKEIHISGGDSAVPPFVVPSRLLEMTGFSEGRWYSPGYGVNMLVKRYLDGRHFAREYVMQKIAGGYSDLVFTGEKDRPDVSKLINDIYRHFSTYGIQSLVNTGEVFFTCRKNNKNYEGYYFAGTRLTTAYGSGNWLVEYLFGFLAEKSKSGMAREVLGHMVKTFKINPRWLAMQSNLTAATSEIVSRTHNEISEIINSSYQYRQRVNDDLSRKWSNVILGLTDVKDPETGETWKVASGRNYYWRKGDSIVGTDTYDRPDIDFTPLEEW